MHLHNIYFISCAVKEKLHKIFFSLCRKMNDQFENNVVYKNRDIDLWNQFCEFSMVEINNFILKDDIYFIHTVAITFCYKLAYLNNRTFSTCDPK